jgi:hypothetical protein
MIVDAMALIDNMMMMTPCTVQLGRAVLLQGCHCAFGEHTRVVLCTQDMGDTRCGGTHQSWSKRGALADVVRRTKGLLIV